MNNTGFYVIDTSKETVSRPEGLLTTGSSTPKANIEWNKRAVMDNGKIVGEAIDKKDNLGLRIVNKKLILDGECIAEATEDNPCISEQSGELRFGNVQLLRGSKCVNITLDNYNKLINGEIVPGYKKYDRDIIYNIVQNVATADVIDCDSLHYPNSPICYTRNGNALAECVEDDFLTFVDPHVPDIEVMPFERIIYNGDNLVVNFNIDTYDHDYLFNNRIGTRFTTIVETARGDVYKKTTYAGRVTMVIPNNTTTQDNEELWFSVRTIQDNGVSSCVQYFDYLVKQPQTECFYQVTQDDLSQYDIVTDNDDPVVSYKNKVGLTALFASKAGQIDPETNLPYTGIKLYNAGNTIYYINYKANVSNTPGEYYFGKNTLYLYKIESVNGSKQISERQLIEQGGVVTVNGEIIPVDEEPISWVRHDRAKLFRNDNNEIRVRWGGRYKENNEVTVSTSSSFLRTYRASEIESKYSNYSSGYYYVVASDIRKIDCGGDIIRFPDNFTIDLNGSTFKATDYYGLGGEATIFQLCRNFNSTIQNGKVVGPYLDIDMPKAQLLLGYGASKVIEGISCTKATNSKYCTFKNLDISQPIGYEGGSPGMESRDGSDEKFYLNPLSSVTGLDKSFPAFSRMGFINYEGEFINPYNTNNYSGIKVDISSPDYVNSKDREITPITLESPVTTTRFFWKDENTGIYYYEHYFRVAAGYDLKGGKYNTCFVSFYDASDNFISTVKVRVLYNVRIPDNAAKLYITTFGISELGNNNTRDAAIYNRSFGSTSKVRGVSTECIGVNADYYGRNNAWIDCYIHHSRTVVICPKCRATHYIRNHYSNLSIEKGTTFEVTAYIGDVEEGAHSITYLNIIDCVVDREIDSLNNSLSAITIDVWRARNFNVIGGHGMGFQLAGGCRSGYFSGDFGGMWLSYFYRSTKPFLIFEDCIFNNGFGTSWNGYNNPKEKYDGSFRYNNCDEPLEDRVAVRDSFLLYHKKAIMGTKPAIPNFIAFRSKVGDTIYK